MRVLFVHQNFPGQYLHLAKALAGDARNELYAIGACKPSGMPGLRYEQYVPEPRQGGGPHPLANEFEAKVRRAAAVARCCEALRREGLVPDIICAHPAWGEAMLLKDVFPESRLVCFQEFYYAMSGSDMDFDREHAHTGLEQAFRLRLKNLSMLMSLEAADWNVTPTLWQRSQYPRWAQERMSVLHDGIDTDRVAPDPHASVRLTARDLRLTGEDEVVSFVSRNLEPYRGFHIFMRALPELLKRRPRARVIIVGGDGVSYGRRLPPGQSYREKALLELGGRLDLSRVHFVGQVPYGTYLNLLQVSALHVYLTYPFVLSWSVLEAMSAECLVLASRTAPVQEVIRDGKNGLLFDFFDSGELVERAVRALERPGDGQEMRHAARRTIIDRYDLNRVCLPGHIALLDALARGDFPAETDAARQPAHKRAGQ